MGVTSATILPAIMQPLLPEKESRNGTGATCLAQAKYCGPAQAIFIGKASPAVPASIPLSSAFRYPSAFLRRCL
jgi:hypothetical protein